LSGDPKYSTDPNNSGDPKYLRIAILCPYSLNVPGGVQGQVLGLARELRRMGHDATVLAPVDPVRRKGDPTGFGHESSGVISLGRSVPIHANGSIAPVALGPTASLRALKALRRLRVDVLHIHEPLAPGASYACLAFGSVPMIGTFHRSGSSVLYTVLGPVARPLAGHLRIRCAVSKDARDTAQKALGGEYEIVRNGVEYERFAAAEPWPTEAPTVIFVGRHEKRKGLRVLLDAFERLADTEAVCWVVGRGPETDELKQRYPESRSVRWLGRIDHENLARRLRGADVACFPSISGESFGVVLLEAMAARSAVVASDLPGYRSAGEGFARLVAPGDPVALGTALRVALSDASSGLGLSSPRSLDLASAHAEASSMTAIAARYVSLYESMID
jgi:phosphatidyl-myo-inositol alpha-mannosyltransferase